MPLIAAKCQTIHTPFHAILRNCSLHQVEAEAAVETEGAAVYFFGSFLVVFAAIRRDFRNVQMRCGVRMFVCVCIGVETEAWPLSPLIAV